MDGERWRSFSRIAAADEVDKASEPFGAFTLQQHAVRLSIAISACKRLSVSYPRRECGARVSSSETQTPCATSRARGAAARTDTLHCITWSLDIWRGVPDPRPWRRPHDSLPLALVICAVCTPAFAVSFLLLAADKWMRSAGSLPFTVKAPARTCSRQYMPHGHGEAAGSATSRTSLA